MMRAILLVLALSACATEPTPRQTPAALTPDEVQRRAAAMEVWKDAGLIPDKRRGCQCESR